MLHLHHFPSELLSCLLADVFNFQGLFKVKIIPILGSAVD